MANSALGRHAVVIGGSIAGLLTGRILTDYFEQVTIVERDRFPDQAQPRKGVPQCMQLHILLTRGRQIIEELFPGLQAELIAQGAVTLDMGADVEWLNPFGWAARFPSGFTALSFSRYILDWLIYRRLTEDSRLHFLEQSYVTQLIATGDGTSVAGVKVRQSQFAGVVQEQVLAADFVVDASGYSSQAPKWLKALGYDEPEETVITTAMGYASRLYEIPQGFQADWKGVYLQAAPPERTSMGVLYPIENNRWIVGVCATAPHRPSKDEVAFLDALQQLPSPIIYDAVQSANPATPIGIYYPPGNRLRHYEVLRRQPEGFVVLGDAVCSFTPIYGQGMTMAALGAITLAECLEILAQQPVSSLTGLAKTFQKRLAEINTAPWIAATSQDAKYPSVKGISKAPSAPERLIGWYMNQVIQLTLHDPQTTLSLFEVFHMLKPAGVLFQPRILVQVLKQVLIPQPKLSQPSKTLTPV
jgi:2-polyprenyl-6-methoxyphenol hydroxylase-like FAD-dependent oxidoreductase